MEKLAGQVATHVSAHVFSSPWNCRKPLVLCGRRSPHLLGFVNLLVSGPLQVLESHHSAGVSGVRGKLDGLVAAGANTSDL